MNVPKIRFSQYDYEWNYEPLNKYVERIVRKNKNNESDLVLTISAQYGLVDQCTFFNRNVSSSNLEGYYLLNNGDFAYNKSYSNGYPWGTVKRLNLYDKGVVSSLYICFKNNSLIDSDYLQHYFETNKWYSQVSSISVEGARNHGLLNIAVNDFFNTQHFFPNIDEQKDIAKVLNLLDKKIELQSKKIEDLKLFKKGLNYKIFSNCKYEYTLKDILMEYNKRTKVNNEYEVLSSTANGIYLQSEYFNKQAASNDTTGYKIIPRGYITYRSMSDTGEFHFNIQNIVNYGIVSPAYPVFNIDETKVNKNYLIYYMNENKNFINTILSTKEGGTRFALSYSKLLSIKIKIPSREEQDQFASLISDINKKIDLEKLKLDNINSLKKGLMQNMFV